MRKHRRHHRQVPDPVGVDPPHLDPPLEDWLIHEARFHLAITSTDYWTCDTCGRAGSFGETAAYPRPPRYGAAKICWGCMTGILLYRGAVNLQASRAPDARPTAVVHLHTAVHQVLQAIERAS